MRALTCPVCTSRVFFENDRCETCDSPLGFDRASAAMAVPGTRCADHGVIGCNWLVAPDATGALCDACALTRTRPNDRDGAAVAAWALTEAAKRRLVYQVDRLGLPTGPGLAFDLLSSRDEPVTTGHADGVITIDLAEGSDPHREAMRVKLAEPYRTMLGHLRHETGHWYWTVLVEDTAHLDRFRALFGDERADYGAALKEHYSGPPGTDWIDTHVTHYAAAHPWEDWAETFAHYLHITDTLETAAAWDVRADGWSARAGTADFGELARTWIGLELVLNQLTRSMGRDDLYPFRLTPTVLEKLRFVHDLVVATGSARAGELSGEQPTEHR